MFSGSKLEVGECTAISDQSPQRFSNSPVMATSFISEHSSEYILVAKLAAMMERYFERVIPLYFLSTREGSLISCQFNPSQVVKIISVFARRPKTMAPNQPHIEVNSMHLFLRSHNFQSR